MDTYTKKQQARKKVWESLLSSKQGNIFKTKFMKDTAVFDDLGVPIKAYPHIDKIIAQLRKKSNAQLSVALKSRTIRFL